MGVVEGEVMWIRSQGVRRGVLCDAQVPCQDAAMASTQVSGLRVIYQKSLCETDDKANDRLGWKGRMTRFGLDIATGTTRDGSSEQHRALIARVSSTDARGQLSS